jgi:hypothetical protein
MGTVLDPTLARAFAIAQERERITQPSPGIEVADGNRYGLTRNSSAPTFTVVTKLDDGETARFDLSGTVLSASPSLQDWREWRRIAQQLTC